MSTRYPRDVAIDFDEPMVFMSNHLSTFDIMALHAVLPNALWVVKRELFRAPFLGWIIWAVGYIGVGRNGNDHAAIRKFSNINRMLEKLECSLLFFPEGHRSRDGKLQAFKKGAARTAIQNQLPILPIAISGTFEIMGPGNLLRPVAGHVTVSFGTPMQPVNLSAILNKKVHLAIEAMLRDQRREVQTHLRAVNSD